MKKEYFALLILLAMPLTLAAQNRPVQTNAVDAGRIELEAKRREMDARRNALRAEAEARRAEVRERIENNRLELREEVVKRKLAHTVRVMSATIERFRNIASRVESRIEKIKARGGNTAESERRLADARGNLDDAARAVSNLASVELSDDSIREDFERIRSLAAEVRGYLRAAHENLMFSVRALGSAEVNLEDSNAN